MVMVLLYAHQYTSGEVRAIIDALAEGRNPQPPGGGTPPPAHTLGLHWAVPEAELKQRSCGLYNGNNQTQAPGPGTTSCFGTVDTTVLAVTEALNSVAGQNVLTQLDNGANAVNLTATVGNLGTQYLGKRFVRSAVASAILPTGSGDIYRGATITQVFVRLYRHVQSNGGDRLWIQTAYPSAIAGGTQVTI